MFRKDGPVNREDGGVLYIKHELHAFEFVPQIKFPLQILCQFEDVKRDKFFVGVCYRTPTDTVYGFDTHNLLRELASEMGSSGRYFLLVGDFNYVFIQWPPVPNVDRLCNDATEFCECLDDNFLVQHVTSPTRKNAILDLIVTDEPDIISDLTDLGPLATSDHNALQWNMQIRTDYCQDSSSIRLYHS